MIDIYPGLSVDLNGLYAVLAGMVGITVSILFSKTKGLK